MKKLFLIVLSSSLLCLFSIGQANATIITNGGFESGLDGWSTEGHVSVVSKYNRTTFRHSTEGNSFALLTAGEPTSSLTSGAFHVNSGDEITFNWFFSAGDYLPFNDYAGFSFNFLDDTTSAVQHILADVLDVGSFGSTGWNQSSILSPKSGMMEISFFVTNFCDYLFPSHLGIDNVHLSSVSVPEPGSMALVFCGLMGIAMMRRKHQRA